MQRGMHAIGNGDPWKNSYWVMCVARFVYYAWNIYLDLYLIMNYNLVVQDQSFLGIILRQNGITFFFKSPSSHVGVVDSGKHFFCTLKSHRKSLKAFTSLCFFTYCDEFPLF